MFIINKNYFSIQLLSLCNFIQDLIVKDFILFFSAITIALPIIFKLFSWLDVYWEILHAPPGNIHPGDDNDLPTAGNDSPGNENDNPTPENDNGGNGSADNPSPDNGNPGTGNTDNPSPGNSNPGTGNTENPSPGNSNPGTGNADNPGNANPTSGKS